MLYLLPPIVAGGTNHLCYLMGCTLSLCISILQVAMKGQSSIWACLKIGYSDGMPGKLPFFDGENHRESIQRYGKGCKMIKTTMNHNRLWNLDVVFPWLPDLRKISKQHHFPMVFAARTPPHNCNCGRLGVAGLGEGTVDGREILHHQKDLLGLLKPL